MITSSTTSKPETQHHKGLHPWSSHHSTPTRVLSNHPIGNQKVPLSGHSSSETWRCPNRVFITDNQPEARQGPHMGPCISGSAYIRDFTNHHNTMADGSARTRDFRISPCMGLLHLGTPLTKMPHQGASSSICSFLNSLFRSRDIHAHRQCTTASHRRPKGS